jgi:predicted transcriptional regulator
MTDNQNRDFSDILLITSDIVSAYVANHQVAPESIPEIVNIVFQSLKAIRSGSHVAPEGKQPAVPIAKSVTPDYIICLEDGKQLKMLKRHLRSAYNMSPEEYRRRWNLPPNYPMVAPNYAEVRSRYARDLGLGKNGGRKKKVVTA